MRENGKDEMLQDEEWEYKEKENEDETTGSSNMLCTFPSFLFQEDSIQTVLYHKDLGLHKDIKVFGLKPSLPSPAYQMLFGEFHIFPIQLSRVPSLELLA